jgi:simple sugar transport system permease protein
VIARRLREAMPVLLALAGAVLVLNLVAFAFGEAPLATLARAVMGTWGTPYGIGQVLFKATPLILTGLAFEVALRAGLFNIGGEGQLALGGLVAAVVAAHLPERTPFVVAFPLALGAAVVAGALVALPPAVMRARLGVHEIISGIMLNRIADAIVPWALVVVVGSTSLRTPDVAKGAMLPRLDALHVRVGGFSMSSLHGSAASLAFPLAVVLAFALSAWLDRSRAGREIRWTGLGLSASRAEGVDVRRRMIQAMLVSGALAGATASATVLGYKGYFELGLGVGAGFSGIAVAMLGRGSPLGIVLASLLFGTLAQAGLAINARVPREAMSVLEAIVIVLVAVGHVARAREKRSIAPEEAQPASAASAPRAEGT